MIDQLPSELKVRPQWVCANSNDKIPKSPITGKNANVTNPSTWGTYEQAKYFASQYSLHLGFVFTKDDPYVFIDLDNKQDDSRLTALHNEIIKAAGDAYVERSISRKGFHIVVKGYLEAGFKSNEHGVEVYSHSRYMLVTGDVYYG